MVASSSRLAANFPAALEPFDSLPWTEFCGLVAARTQLLPDLRSARGRPASSSEASVERVLRGYMSKGLIEPGQRGTDGRHYGYRHYLQYLYVKGALASGKTLADLESEMARDGEIRRMPTEALRASVSKLFESGQGAASPLDAAPASMSAPSMNAMSFRAAEIEPAAPPEELLEALFRAPPLPGRRPIDAYELGRGITLHLDRSRFRKLRPEAVRQVVQAISRILAE